MKLLSNRTAKIKIDEPDYFNSSDKGSAIKYFLESAREGLKDNNMIVLYGQWGSGKSTLMEHIERQIDKRLYKTVFFTAWEHEKDSNLALSLVDAITDNLDRNDTIKEFRKEAVGFLINMFRGLTIKTPEVLGLSLEYDFDKQQKAIDKFYKKIESGKSYFKKLSEFKQKFRKMEDTMLEEGQKLIVFIDDLDRCEPENILTLLSAIKLFFSLGERTIFFFGVDKKAITNAVKTKYGDIIKADEYLEKIFDISFEMPKSTSIYSLVAHYFPEHTTEIVGFFTSIDFINPRHLKKVLNKYMIVSTFKSGGMPSSLSRLIPDIYDKHGGEFMETIFTLFVIILHEYYYETFKELEDYEAKIVEYARIYEKNLNRTFKDTIGIITDPNFGYCFPSLRHRISELITMAKDLKATPNDPLQDNRRFIKFLSIFTPKQIEKLQQNTANVNEEDFVRQFDDGSNKVLISFCYFLISNKDKIMKMDSVYIFSDFFLMARTVL